MTGPATRLITIAAGAARRAAAGNRSPLAMADRPRVGRVLILLGWLWLGWHYFAR